MDVWIWIIIGIASAAIIVALALGAWRVARRRRSAELRKDFGPEYGRVVGEWGQKGGEDELRARKHRVQRLVLQPLGEADRHRLNGEWRDIERKFIDSPNQAVRLANALVEETLRLRGFPSADFDQRLADISVDHPFVVEHYRAARQIWRDGDRAPDVDTEGLRQAMRHYHLVFAELVNASTEIPGRGERMTG